MAESNVCKFDVMSLAEFIVVIERWMAVLRNQIYSRISHIVLGAIKGGINAQ